MKVALAVVLSSCLAFCSAFSGVTPALRVAGRPSAVSVRRPYTAHSLNMVTGDAGKTKLKGFLDDAKKLGKVRLISQNEATVMEAIATLEEATADGLFYAAGGPKQLEYANVIDPKINLDLHLLLDAVGGARFENGVSRTPTKDPTYIIRVTGNDAEKVVLSIFLQWDKEPADVSKDRINAWSAMKAKYGERVSF